MKAFGATGVSGNALDAAVVDLLGDAAHDPFVDGAHHDFVAKPHAAAVAPMTPASPLAKYADALAIPQPPPRISLHALGRDLDLCADPDELAELILVLYVLEGWDSIRRLEEAIVIRRSQVEGELAAAEKALETARTWVSRDVSGYPEQRLEAEASLPRLERESRDLADRTPGTLQLLDAIKQTFQHQKTILIERLDALIETFELQARADLLRVLAESERAVRDELKRYGVKKKGDPLRTVTIADNDDTRGLRKALDQLAQFRSRVLEPLQAEMLAATGVKAIVDFAVVLKLFKEIVSGLNPNLEAMMRHPALTATHAQEGNVRRQLEAVQLDYARLRAGVAEKYPIVHRIAEHVDEKTDAERLASTISAHAYCVRRNIQKIRVEGAAEHPPPTRERVIVPRDIDPAERVAAHALAQSMDVWDMPRVLDLTRQRLEGLGFDEAGVGYTLLCRVLRRIPELRRERHEFCDTVGFALALLSAPTGGASLLVLGVMGGVRAIAEIVDYGQKLTLLNSALDPVQAMTDNDPSGWQLLVNLVFYGLDVLEAGAALRSLGPAAARAAR
ncbi:MAG: hypothetical protein ACRDLY_00525, partial [Thermoleophilaceae bacterium]